MNIIHSSSLTHYSAIYNKPQSGLMNGDKVPVKDDNTRQGSEESTRPSSVEQIQSALAKAGLNKPIANLPITTRAQKALDAYIQNNNQTARYQVAQSYSGIDLHV